MNPDRQRLAEEIFKSVLAAEPHDPHVPHNPHLREVKLLDRCGQDSDLLREVQSLLRAHDAGTGPLDHPAPALSGVVDADEAAGALTAGSKVGPYRIVSLLGTGGMGVVYIAEQDRPRRTVALKIIRPGFAAPSVLKRFEYEAELLGRLQHPGIAQIIEAGAADSGHGPQPFFAMELVDGLPLTRFANQHHLSIRDRLALMLKVCEAVEHAHQRGIIHRDLKPSNILVDQTHQPKVLDFGVARATGGNEADQRLTLLRTGERQLVGTLAYMSPEQVSGNPAEIDTRSDIYSLGVILYELLCGDRPHSLQDRALPDAVRIIRDEDPRRLAAHHSSFRGDLDTIAAKALEKDKARRYQSASELAADIRRYLEHAPIAARPPSAIYQLRKFARRHRALVAGAGLALAALLVATPVSITAYLRANRALAFAETKRQDAERARASEEKLRIGAQASELAEHLAATRSEQVAKFLKEMLDSIDPAVAKGRDTGVLKEILTNTEARLANELHDQPEVEAELRVVIAGTYRSLDEREKAEANQRLAADLYKSAKGDHSAEYISAITGLARFRQDQSDLMSAGKLYDEALPLARETLGNDHVLTADLLYQIGNFKRINGDLPAAESFLNESLEISRRITGDRTPEIISALNVLALVLKDEGKYAPAVERYREVLTIQESRTGRDDPFFAAVLQNMANALYLAGRFDEAEPAYRESLATRIKLLGEDHSSTAIARSSLAVLLSAQGNLDEAVTLLRQAVDIQHRRLGPDHIEVAKAMSNLAGALRDQALDEQTSFDEPESLYQEALRIQTTVLGPAHAQVADTYLNLALLESYKGDLPAAEKHARQALDIARKALVPDHPNLAQAKAQLATILTRIARDNRTGPTRAHAADLAAESEQLLREAMPLRLKRFPPDHWQIPNLKGQLGEAVVTAATTSPEFAAGSESIIARLKEAEPLCLESYEGIRARAAKIPPPQRDRLLKNSAERLARLYDTWNVAEPNTGMDKKAADVRGRERPTITKPN